MTHIPARQPEGIPAGGQFATMTRPEAEGVVLAPVEEAADINQMLAERDQLRQAWEIAGDTDSPEHELLDRQMQHASVQLAAAVLKRRAPGAELLVIRENQDGENQYEILAVTDKHFNEVPGAGDSVEWAFDEISGTNSPTLSELAWSLDLKNDAWAEGIAEVSESDHTGKMATINIADALAKPAPARERTAREKTAAAADRYDDLRDIRERARRQAEMLEGLSQHATVQLLASSILEKHPTATRLNLRDDLDGNDILQPVSVMDEEGTVLEFADVPGGLFDQYVPGGADSYSELIESLDLKKPTWADDIATVKANRYQTYVYMDLNAAMAKPAPDFPEMTNPYTKPLTRNEQADLVQAARFGVRGIAEAAGDASNNIEQEALKDLARRTRGIVTH